MLTEILFAFVQAATEFLPISSSGHLALLSNIISQPDLSFFVMLHLASLVAVIIFTRREIISLLRFDKDAINMWKLLIIATIPAALVGYFFKDTIESFFSSYLFLSAAFAFTGIILISTKNCKGNSLLNEKRSLLVGLFQTLALLPGVSRSGMTISAGLMSGVDRKRMAKFSFLLFIPLSLGAFILEFDKVRFDLTTIVAFFVCLFASILFLNILIKILEKRKFWIFSLYCFAASIISLLLYLLNS
jgi:undecaprenyl-diphosphatase